MSPSKFEFLHSLSERLQNSASVRTIYGEPIEVQGKTIIPVGRVAYGLGGGYGRTKAGCQGGQAPEQQQQSPLPAESGGGGITVTPLGVFEVSPEQTRFIALPDTKGVWIVALVAGFALGRLLRRERW